MKNYMKAALYYGPGDIRIQEIEKPQVDPDGVVVKIHACGVCNIMDADEWVKWRTRGHATTGLARGHEWSGEIVEVGSSVNNFKIGDIIFSNPVFQPCHECASCRVNDYWRCINWHRGMLGMGLHGGFAEYLRIPFITEESAAKLPDTLSFRDLAMIEPLYLSVGLADKAKAGDVVVVIGQELMGLGTVLQLKENGIEKVIACDVSKKRLRAAEELGADVIIDTLSQDPAQVIMKETKGKGADVVILIDRKPLAFLQAISVTRPAGIIWLATYYYSPLKLDPSLPAGKELWIGPGSGYTDSAIYFDPSLITVQSAWGTLGPRVPRWLKAAKILESGRINANTHITHVFSLDQTKEAFDVAMDPFETIKVVVEP
jgi:L-iditol 2-dehydrogenase